MGHPVIPSVWLQFSRSWIKYAEACGLVPETLRVLGKLKHALPGWSGGALLGRRVRGRRRGATVAQVGQPGASLGSQAVLGKTQDEIPVFLLRVGPPAH